MLTADVFEELLAAYPAEKRELARQVYCRFAEGDSTQFFTQLFLVLDIYAHYAERVPQAVIEANQNAHANFARLREEIGLLAQLLNFRVGRGVPERVGRRGDLSLQRDAPGRRISGHRQEIVRGLLHGG